MDTRLLLLVVASCALSACMEPVEAVRASADAPTPAYLDGKADRLGPASTGGRVDERLDSREYKVLLDPSLFDGAGPEQMVAFLEDEILDRVSFESEGALASLRSTRTIRFWDTPGDCELRTRGFVFRERVDEGEREATLKFRSPDRYVTSATDVGSDDDDAESKFEEDIKPGYRSVFSKSTSVPVSHTKTLNRLDDVEDLFDSARRLKLDDDREIVPVGGLSVHELVFGRREFDLGELEAKMSVTLWYVNSGDHAPAVAELSFKYKQREDSLDPNSVARGMRLFEALQSLDEWTAPESTTKTAMVYGYAPTFCDN